MYVYYLICIFDTYVICGNSGFAACDARLVESSSTLPCLVTGRRMIVSVLMCNNKAFVLYIMFTHLPYDNNSGDKVIEG